MGWLFPQNKEQVAYKHLEGQFEKTNANLLEEYIYKHMNFSRLLVLLNNSTESQIRKKKKNTQVSIFHVLSKTIANCTDLDPVRSSKPLL